jgi:hypothetical protein
MSGYTIDGLWFPTAAQALHFERTGQSVTEQEAAMAGQSTAMDTFGAKYTTLRATAESLFDQLHGIQRFLNANPQIAAEAQAADAGALIGGSLMSKELVLTALMLFANGSAFAGAEIAPGLGFTNEDAVLRMG